ncbi:ATP synthase F1 subcomplex epsilon subunit [Devosia enhydra]|uniref:ATP synthase epsilon chain n=1 Tax=Devosia enhydra TaxID=665118 RepID=A0A1K2HZ58_9HYPH|nr:F0F1 ATP synthase subunit epsilon [Devosia enhydra]SFZ85357.1 ATP synthase F1 subcomplex epsilon subunit [Devosia enhydra]
MAEGFKIDIVSPERLVVSATAQAVTVPGSEGYLTVMAQHSPLMTTLKPGFITVTELSGTSHRFFVTGGFADVTPASLTILAEDARPAAEFDRAEIEARIAEAQAAANAAPPESRNALQAIADDWRNLLLDASVNTSVAH